MAPAKAGQPDTPAIADSVKTGNRTAGRACKTDEILRAVKRMKSYGQ